MKTFILFLGLISFQITSGQSKDLTKKQALEAFKKSELRKAEKIPVSSFEKIYNTAKCVQKNFSDKEYYPDAVKIKTMPIFSNVSAERNKLELKSNSNFRYYGVFMQFPEKDDNGNKTKCL